MKHREFLFSNGLDTGVICDGPTLLHLDGGSNGTLSIKADALGVDGPPGVNVTIRCDMPIMPNSIMQLGSSARM